MTVDPGVSVASVTVNGVPVDSVDSTGKFFTQVFVAPGLNDFGFTVTDTLAQLPQRFQKTTILEKDLGRFLP